MIICRPPGAPRGAPPTRAQRSGGADPAHFFLAPRSRAQGEAAAAEAAASGKSAADFKAEGNAAFSSGDYEKAFECFSCAIAVDGSDKVRGGGGAKGGRQRRGC